jgi:hypothetical protein
MAGPAINEQLLIWAAQNVSGECLNPREIRFREGAIEGDQSREVFIAKACYTDAKSADLSVIISHAWPSSKAPVRGGPGSSRRFASTS